MDINTAGIHVVAMFALMGVFSSGCADASDMWECRVYAFVADPEAQVEPPAPVCAIVCGGPGPHPIVEVDCDAWEGRNVTPSRIDGGTR